jgi:hypothetical protein
MSGDQGRVIGTGGPRIKVRVTENDIKWAVREDSTRCMVAKALARQVDDAHRIEVDTQTIRFTTATGRFAYLTPLRVQQYVAAFDAGDPVEPFEFSLRNGLRIKQRILTPEQRDEIRLRQLTEETRSGGRSRVPGVRKSGRLAGGIQPTGYTTPGDTESPPRVFKTKKRTYGHRLLRINQPMQPTALDEGNTP